MNLGSLLPKWLTLVWIVFVCSLPLRLGAQIKTTHISDGYPNLGQGIRPLGMGNAFLTMPGTDENALFYNPAALQDFDKSWRYSFSPIGGVSFNKRLITTVKDVFDLSTSLKDSGTTSGDIDAFDKFITDHNGEFQSVRLRIPLFMMLRKGWAGGILVDTRTTVSFRGNTAVRNFEIRSRNDGAAVFGKSVGLLGNDLSVGCLVKGIYRLNLDRIIVTSDIIGNELGSLIGFKQWGKAVGIGADVGARYKLPFLFGWSPAIAVVYQDIGRTRFFGSDTDDNPQTVSAGVGIHPRLGSIETSVEVAMTDLTHRRDLMTRLHGGAEVRFPWMGPMRLSLRAGANQGYPTGGMSLDFKKVKWDTAFFGEEVGETKRQGKSYKFASELSFAF